MMKRFRPKWFFLALVTPPVLAAVSYGGYLYWYSHRAQPTPEQRDLFPGILYTREVTQTPVPLVTHLVRVNLETPGLEFLVTPGEHGQKLPLKARTTTQFAQEFGQQIAINADFFYPWHSNGVFDYYPHVGDPVTTEGFAASRGVPYSDEPDKTHFPTFYLSKTNRVSFVRPAKGEIYNAISGLWKLLEHGQFTPLTDPKLHPDRDPRCAIGVSSDGKTLILAVFDGRQPHYSEGATVREVAETLQRNGVTDAMLLDGGGSACLVAEERPGEYRTLNSVIDKRLPGRQRPIANHLGIRINSMKKP